MATIYNIWDTPKKMGMKPHGFFCFLHPRYETGYVTRHETRYITMGYETSMKPGIHFYTNVDHIKRRMNKQLIGP